MVKEDKAIKKAENQRGRTSPKSGFLAENPEKGGYGGKKEKRREE